MPKYSKKSPDNAKEKKLEKKKSSHKSKKSKRSRSSSTSSPSSIQEDGSVKLLKILEDKRMREYVQRKKLKEEMKAKETPEEKRSRRLKEKEAKEIRRRHRMGWDNEYQHYTNQDNPFGDSNLMSTFVWNKKLEKEGLTNVAAETVEVLSRHKQIENKIELQKVKKRRVERELERQTREDEMMLMQRSREAAQFQEWERQEDKFHLEQARLRSVIRIQDGRAKPIDLLAQYVSNTNLEESIEMQMHEPYYILNGLRAKDLEDLLVDIKVYIELEKGKNSDFWNDMTVIVEDELKKLNKLELEGESQAVVGRRDGIHQSVVKEVSDIFKGKTTTQLDELKNRIEVKIESKSAGLDISYWESLLSQLKAHMARARLRDKHQENLKQKLQLLKSEPDVDALSEMPSTSKVSQEVNANNETNTENALLENDSQEASAANNLLEMCFELYEKGDYSPIYISPTEIDDNVVVMSEDRNENNIESLRKQLFEMKSGERSLSREELQMRCEARKGMMDDEVEFSVESPISAQVHLSSDKYRPRKPRYFNRVHTGFEWNKYNQTHYDMDNPPPKIVQGYKFNIFYPDLINKSTTPQYILTPCEDNADFSVLRFHAGPPYEDIAFKIVNREWEFSYKRGFRCQFHNNIFQLWFHFKRYRYRR